MENILQYFNANINWLSPLGIVGVGFAQGVWTWLLTQNKEIAVVLSVSFAMALIILWYVLIPLFEIL